jgi:hypothetical protein
MKKPVLLFIMLAPLSLYAGVYKWVDDNGKVHYGDQPQSSQPSIEMNIDVTSPAPVGSGEDQLTREEKRERLLQSMEEDRLEKHEQREKQKALRAQNRQKCNRYRDRMRHYQRANALYRLDKDGKRVYVSDSDRAKSTKKLQAQIDRYCK